MNFFIYLHVLSLVSFLRLTWWLPVTGRHSSWCKEAWYLWGETGMWTFPSSPWQSDCGQSVSSDLTLISILHKFARLSLVNASLHRTGPVFLWTWGRLLQLGPRWAPEALEILVSLVSILLACHLTKCAVAPVSNAEKKSKEARRRLQLCKGWKLEKEVS